MKRGRVHLVFFIVATAAFVAGAQAPAPAPAAEAPTPLTIDAEAQKVLKSVTDALSKAKTLAYKAVSTTRVTGPDMNEQMESKYEITIERPNKIVLRHQGMPTGSTLVSNGTKLFYFDPASREYIVRPAPETLEPFTTPGASRGAPPDHDLVISLANDDPYAALTEGVTEVVLAGKETLDGKDTQRLTFKDEEMDWDLWVTPGESPRIVRLKPDLSRLVARHSGGRPEVSIDMSVSFSDWNIDGELPASAFTFTPPAGAKKVRYFGEVPHTLVGQPAPAFSLTALDGTKVELSTLKDKVVILDFWATWCTACREGMPVLDKVVEEYAKKGVVAYAVNVGETADMIAAFLQNTGIKANVVLDSQGTTASDYVVDGLPQTVVIRPDGVVHDILVGVSPMFEEEMKEAIDGAFAAVPKATACAKQ